VAHWRVQASATAFLHSHAAMCWPYRVVNFTMPPWSKVRKSTDSRTFKDPLVLFGPLRLGSTCPKNWIFMLEVRSKNWDSICAWPLRLGRVRSLLVFSTCPKNWIFMLEVRSKNWDSMRWVGQCGSVSVKVKVTPFLLPSL
jgi:hypothetical protein